jgi:tripartite-type tricarboxylate transporter receptor subunit TctC
MRKMFKALAALSLATGLVTGAAAAEWPEKPVNVVLGFEAGGGLDQSMLPLKPLLEKKLGQPFLLNYKPGAGGRIGFEFVHLRGADGYTISALSEPHYSNTTVFDKPRYKITDMVPVGLIGRDVPILFVHKDSPYKDLNDIIAAAKARPGEITVATGSFTGEQYLMVAILEEMAGIKFRAVNVGGGAKVMTNVVGKHLEIGVSRPASITGIKNEIRGIAVLGAKRNAIFPETKTFDEQLPETMRIPHFSSSRGLMVHREFAEKNPEAFKRLETALREALESPEYKAAMERMGLESEFVSAADAQKEVLETAKMMEKYKELVEKAKTRS